MATNKIKTIQSIKISGVLILKTSDYPDLRGSFTELLSSKFLKVNQLDFFKIKQVNLSRSNQQVFRGIHYSVAKKLQHKIVTCLQGSVTDFIVDLRIGSPTFRKIDIIELDAKSKKIVFIPAGCGHGFLSKEDDTLVFYAQSSEYSPTEEFELSCFDQSLDLGFKDKKKLILSSKDELALNLKDLEKRRLLPEYLIA